jgi:transcriptional regulator with XRE-family HTH domain
MEEIISFGHWLKLRRQALRLTQGMLAGRVYCSSELIRKIEADARQPSPVVAARLAEQLGLSAHQRVTFVKVARGELRVDWLPAPTQVPAWPDTDAPVRERRSLPVPATSLIGRESELAELGTPRRSPTARRLFRSRRSVQVRSWRPQSWPHSMLRFAASAIHASTCWSICVRKSCCSFWTTSSSYLHPT